MNYTSVYLAGNMTCIAPEKFLSERRGVSKLLKVAGFKVLDPANKNRKSTTASDYIRDSVSMTPKEIVEHDLRLIDASDILLADLSRGPGYGMAMEVFYAFRRGKIVIGYITNLAGDTFRQELSPWLIAHCHFITDTVKEAIEHAKWLDLELGL